MACNTVHLTQQSIERGHLVYLHLLESGGRQLVYDNFCLSAELLLSGGIAHGAGSVGDNVVGIPHSRVHACCTLCQGLGDESHSISHNRVQSWREGDLTM